MARQSIPANPVDEQILSLQRQLANCQNDLEVKQEEYQARLEEARLSVSRQNEEIAKLQTDNHTSTTRIESLMNLKLERDKEIEYLQEQLEVLINEKISLQNQLTDLETQLKTAKEMPQTGNMMIIEVDRLKLKLIELEEQVEKQRTEITQLESDKVELEQCRSRIADLESQLNVAKQMNDPMSLPLGPPALRLRDLQLRIDALTRAFRT